MQGYRVDAWRPARRARRQDPQWALSTRPGIRLLDLPDTRMRVRLAGRGTGTIVFVCDPPNVVEAYDEVIERLGDAYRVVVLEMPGFGFSYPKPGFDFSRRAYADAIAQALDELRLGPYALAAPCISCFTALQIAHDRPDLIERLVLMQASDWTRQRAWAAMVVARFLLATAGLPVLGRQVTATPVLGQVVWAAVESSFARRTHPHVVHKAAERPERFRQMAEPVYAAFEHGACNCMASGFQRYFNDPESAIPVVDQPALILWASADRSHKPSNQRGLKTYAPKAAWEEVPDTGHHLELENPAAVTGAIRRFLAGW